MKRDPDQCCECARTGRHSATCSRGRCQSCHRAPATIGLWCGPCWSRVMKARREVVAERLLRMDPEKTDGGR
jgi:hypothetical protein